MNRDRRRKSKSNVLDEANVWQRIQARLTDLPLPWTVYCPTKAARRISLIANSM
jgi:hypothetical protein